MSVEQTYKFPSVVFTLLKLVGVVYIHVSYTRKVETALSKFFCQKNLLVVCETYLKTRSEAFTVIHTHS